MTLEELYSKYGDDLRRMYPNYSDSMSGSNYMRSSRPELYREPKQTQEEAISALGTRWKMNNDPNYRSQIMELYRLKPEAFTNDEKLMKIMRPYIGKYYM